MDLYQYKEKLQLESWHHNKYLSEDMKQFFRDIIQNSQEHITMNNRIYTLENDIRVIELYLNNKGVLKQFTNFKHFIGNDLYTSDIKIKNFGCKMTEI